MAVFVRSGNVHVIKNCRKEDTSKRVTWQFLVFCHVHGFPFLKLDFFSVAFAREVM